MENSYILMTDSDSDLYYQIADEKGIPVIKMPYSLDGEGYEDDNGRTGQEKRLFQRMREGSAPSTSLLPVEAYVEFFEPMVQHKDILFIAFSSQMSGTMANARFAADGLMKKYPGRRIRIVDTLSISGPLTLLVLGAHRLYEQGADMDAVEKWVMDNRMRAHAWLTVGDLKYLARGGRISSTSAVFGNVLSIHPIICMGKGGKMEAVDKVRGYKNTLKTLVEYTAKYIENPAEQTLLVFHADVPEEAQTLADMIRDRIPNIADIRIQMVGPVIGCHCGPGTLATVFMGREREK